MRTIEVSTILDAPADVIWPATKTPHAFVYVARGMLRFPASERLERPWQVGDEVRGWIFLFGVVPFSKHRIVVDSIDEEARVLISNEGGGPIRTWRHELITTEVNARQCHYTDRIHIDAGLLTPLVAGFAKLFYRYRQRRWRQIAPLLAACNRSDRG